MNNIERAEVGFAQVANCVLFDPSMSLKAKGLFAYIYAKPVNWQFSAKRIADELLEGRDAILRSMKELEACGYLVRVKRGSGRVDYLLSHKKPESKNLSLGQEPESEKPTVGKAHRGVSRPISNKEFNKQREDINTIATPQEDVAKVVKKVKAKADPNEPKSLKDFMDDCQKSSNPSLHIIGEWADTIKPNFTTRGEWSVFLKRNLRPAGDLSKFPKHQVERAYTQILKDSKDGEKFRPTLETIIKYLIK